MESATSNLFSRRRFLKRAVYAAGGTAALGMGTGVYAHWIEPYWVEYHDVEVPVPALPEVFDGFTIALVADIHCGPLLGAEWVRAVFRRILARKPDIIAIAGDLVHSGHDAWAMLVPELARLAEEALTLVVPGNHDYWEGIEEFRRGVAAAGAADLINRCRVIERDGCRMVVAGLDDLWGGQPDLDVALDGVERTAQPVLLLLHNPDSFPDVRGQGVDLVLAGHTHGGQVKPPFLPAPVVPVKHKEYTSGMFAEDGTAMYVSRGVGMIVQVRLNCRPEVPFIVLRHAPEASAKGGRR